MKSSKYIYMSIFIIFMSFSVLASGCSQFSAASADLSYTGTPENDISKIESSVPKVSVESSEPESSVSEISLESSEPESSVSEISLESSEPESSVPEVSFESSEPESSVPEVSFESSESESSASQADSGTTMYIYDPDFFTRSAFSGNSVLMGFDVYRIIPKADFYCNEGLTIYDFLYSTLPNQEDTVIEQIIKNKDKYDKLFLMFSTNETGFYDKNAFINYYEKAVNILQSKMPQTKIYIQSILPVTAEKSAANYYGLNNGQIEKYNEQLKALAEQKSITYIDLTPIFTDENGCLLSDSSPDGVHINPNDYIRWMCYLKENAN